MQRKIRDLLADAFRGLQAHEQARSRSDDITAQQQISYNCRDKRRAEEKALFQRQGTQSIESRRARRLGGIRRPARRIHSRICDRRYAT